MKHSNKLFNSILLKEGKYYFLRFEFKSLLGLCGSTMRLNLFYFNSTDETTQSKNANDYWSVPHPQLAHLPQLPHPLSNPKVQVMPAHPVTPMLPSSPPPTPPQAAEDKDKFKCLYLLVETAVAVRQREKEQEDVPI